MQYQKSLVRIILLTVTVAVFGQADWAEAAEARAEDAYLKILNVYRNDNPPPDPNTRDRDGNGIVDRVHYRLFDSILANPAAPHYAEITAAYVANFAQVQRDNSGGVVCLFLPSLYGFTCDDFNRYAASLMTIGEPAAVALLMTELASRMHITFDLNDYDLTMGQYLQGAMDLDGDAISNTREFNSVCGDFDQYIQAATDPLLTPATLPCCGDCPLTIVQQPVGASVYVHGMHAFMVAVDKVETVAHYQWYKGETMIGADAPELNLSDIQRSDAGEYWCRITDDTEEVMSGKVLLIVAEHLAIAAQPQGADLRPGDSYTLFVAVTGGLGSIHYYWYTDAGLIGEDAQQLVLSDLQTGNSGTYWCEIADDNERIISEHVQLNIVPPEEGEGALEGEVEGVQSEGEGQPEGMLEGEGVAEGLPEGALEGSPAEGEMEGVQSEGEGQPEGMLEGEGALEGTPAEGEMEGMQSEGEGQLEGMLEGEGVAEGLPEGAFEGSLAEGEMEGMQPEGEGQPEGMLEGEGIAEGQHEGTIEGLPEGAIEGAPNEGVMEGELQEGEGFGEGELTEGEAVEGEASEGEGLGEGELTEGEAAEGEGLGEGELTEGEVVEGEVVEGEGLGEGELTEGEAVEGEGLGEGELTEGETGEGEGENGIGCFNGDQNNPENWQSLGDLLLSFLTIIFLTLIRRLFWE